MNEQTSEPPLTETNDASAPVEADGEMNSSLFVIGERGTDNRPLPKSEIENANAEYKATVEVVEAGDENSPTLRLVLSFESGGFSMVFSREFPDQPELFAKISALQSEIAYAVEGALANEPASPIQEISAIAATLAETE